MDDTPLYKRPWFFIVAWLLVLSIAYFWDIFRLGGAYARQAQTVFDLVCVFPLLLFLWMAFFSQFILPVRTLSDRLNIFIRLIARLFGVRGPAIFIKNGVEDKEREEEKRKGPGVLWLDSASGAVTRNATKVLQKLGPGVHFTQKGETIAGAVDLHTQTHTIGPRENEKPFAEKSDDQSEETYKQIQDRRKQVSALTRDGIEIVPTINVLFRVNTGVPQAGQSGSRFGYRSGVTPKDKKDEKADQDAIYKAVIGESVNPYYGSESPRHRIAWNELPAALAVDVWREYASKFKLDEFFTPSQPPLPERPPIVEPTEEEIDPLTQAIQAGPDRDFLQTLLAKFLRAINLWMARHTPLVEKTYISPTAAIAPPPHSPPPPAKTTGMKTALEVINEALKARLTRPSVEILDQFGQWRENSPTGFSPEFDQLQKRGLKVISVNINNLRLHPAIDAELIAKWETSWIKHANVEKEQMESYKNLHETASQEQAVKKYAEWLGEAVVRANPERGQIKEALKSLLSRTRAIIMRNNQLRRRMDAERQEIEEILRWIEASES